MEVEHYLFLCTFTFSSISPFNWIITFFPWHKRGFKSQTAGFLSRHVSLPLSQTLASSCMLKFEFILISFESFQTEGKIYIFLCSLQVIFALKYFEVSSWCSKKNREQLVINKSWTCCNNSMLKWSVLVFNLFIELINKFKTLITLLIY